MILSGAICGIAGFLLVSGQDHTITKDTAGGNGFTAIMVSWLAKFDPLWMVLTAFKTTAETMQIDPFVLVPQVWQYQNFSKVIAAMDFLKLYENTLLPGCLRNLLPLHG